MNAPERTPATTPGSTADGHETARKLVHIAASVTAAALAATLPVPTVRALLLAALIVAIGVERIRRRSQTAQRTFLRAFHGMLRRREVQNVTGATTLAAGFAATALITPPPFAATGILAAGLADAAAAIIGRRVGKRRLRTGKSVEGSTACFLTALAVVWAMTGGGAVPALATATAITLLEAAPLPGDDNLWLPPVAGLVAHLTASIP